VIRFSNEAISWAWAGTEKVAIVRPSVDINRKKAIRRGTAKFFIGITALKGNASDDGISNRVFVFRPERSFVFYPERSEGTLLYREF